uniref:DUF148 domain-containing protein n=1 Tax=Trichobilharzia regenti TaxID=157069 RepID=A0AA85J2W6_TRIRE|nr:unnamed protein product [Trichobilharzia regenti]
MRNILLTASLCLLLLLSNNNAISEKTQPVTTMSETTESNGRHLRSTTTPHFKSTTPETQPVTTMSETTESNGRHLRSTTTPHFKSTTPETQPVTTMSETTESNGRHLRSTTTPHFKSTTPETQPVTTMSETTESNGRHLRSTTTPHFKSTTPETQPVTTMSETTESNGRHLRSTTTPHFKSTTPETQPVTTMSETTESNGRHLRSTTTPHFKSTTPETQPVTTMSETTESNGRHLRSTTTPHFKSTTPETQPVTTMSETTESNGRHLRSTTTPHFKSTTPETQPVTTMSETTESNGRHLRSTTTPHFKSTTPDGEITYYNRSYALNAYADSYREVVDYKFRMLEIQTYKGPRNFEEIIKPEILRLEHLYQSKWAKEFLESTGAGDEKLVNSYIDEYRKALEEDTAFDYKVLANKQLYNLTKTHISKKWKNRKDLNIAEGIFFAETSDSLKNDEVQTEMINKNFIEAKEAVKTSKAKLKVLETAAVRTTHEYRDTLNFFRNPKNRRYTSEELRDNIKLLEEIRFEFLKFQTLEDGINWLLDEMKEDAKQYY